MSEPPHLNVVELPTSAIHDPVGMLRRLADDIEAGSYGEVGTVAVAVVGDTLEVFGGGPDSAGPTVALVFNAAILRLARSIERHGRE